ncbi:MAG: arylesterase [Desulfobacterales bacterium]|nr:arylesterase [Desulfobacterales bacterium]
MTCISPKIKGLFLSIMAGCLIFVSGVSAADAKPVLILGDSLTAGLGVMPEQAYPSLIQKRLEKAGRGAVRIINGGISGSTSAGAYARLKWYLKARPGILILALGANDGLRGLPVREMEKNLDKTIVLAKESDIRVIIAGMQIPPNYGPDYAASFRQVFPDLARRHNIPLIPFLLEGVAGMAGLNQADGIHPNPLGHEIIADQVYPYILESL